MKTEKELIDDFMGPSIINNGVVQDPTYSNSWDKLMPVVKKIANECLNKGWGSTTILSEMIQKWKAIAAALEDVDIERAHKAVVEFIKWYHTHDQE